MALLPLPFNLSRVNQTQLPSLCNHVDLASLAGLGRTFLPILIFTNVLLLGEIKPERGSGKMMTRAKSYFFSSQPTFLKVAQGLFVFLFKKKV